MATLRALQTGALRYCCLDAAQLIKHLLGVHSALKAGVLTGPSSVTLLFWPPAEPGRFCTLFDRLEAEFDDLASRLADQPVTWSRWSTRDLLDAWSAADAQPGEALHAATLRARYDVPLAR